MTAQKLQFWRAYGLGMTLAFVIVIWLVSISHRSFMSTTHAGMPGPGGSLGQCCYCGKDFLAEILLSKTVKPVQVAGCDQTLYVHQRCVKKLQACKEYPKLPDESPLKAAWLKAVAEPA